MTSCKYAALLLSRALDTPLTWRERLSLRVHLAICDMCRRFRQQLDAIQRAMRRSIDPEERLSDEARERIRKRLQDGES
jgi:anti-sigma factor ChrR (cupin superfamily)